MNAGQYIDLALDDDYVRTQMREAAVHARKAFVRGRNQPTKRAVQDQKLLDHIAAAAASMQEAVRSLGEPRHKPAHRRARTARLLVLALAVGAAAAYADRRMAHVSRAVAAEPPH
jgi:hypothetical protein